MEIVCIVSTLLPRNDNLYRYVEDIAIKEKSVLHKHCLYIIGTFRQNAEKNKIQKKHYISEKNMFQTLFV